MCCSNLCCAAHTFCVSMLYVHVVFNDKHVLILCAGARVYICLPQTKLKLLFYFLMLIIYLFLGLLVSIST